MCWEAFGDINGFDCGMDHVYSALEKDASNSNKLLDDLITMGCDCFVTTYSFPDKVDGFNFLATFRYKTSVCCEIRKHFYFGHEGDAELLRVWIIGNMSVEKTNKLFCNDLAKHNYATEFRIADDLALSWDHDTIPDRYDITSKNHYIRGEHELEKGHLAFVPLNTQLAIVSKITSEKKLKELRETVYYPETRELINYKLAEGPDKFSDYLFFECSKEIRLHMLGGKDGQRSLVNTLTEKPNLDDLIDNFTLRLAGGAYEDPLFRSKSNEQYKKHFEDSLEFQYEFIKKMSPERVNKIDVGTLLALSEAAQLEARGKMSRKRLTELKSIEKKLDMAV